MKDLKHAVRTKNPLVWDFGVCLATFSLLFVMPLFLILPSALVKVFVFWDLLISVLYTADFVWIPAASKKKAPRSSSVSLVFSLLPLLSLFFFFGGGASPLWGVLLLLPRFFYAPRLFHRLKALHDTFKLPSWFVPSMLIVLCFAIIHDIACFYLALFPQEEAQLAAYTKATWWTIGTIIYGGDDPGKSGGRIFMMVVMLFGMTLHGLLIAQVSTFFIKADKRQEDNREKLENLKAFFGHYDIPTELQEQVLNVYRNRLDRKLNENEQQILQELPKYFEEELQIYVNMRHLAKVDLFKGCTKACLKAAAEKLQERHLNPNDVLIRTGDPGQEMYLLAHGRLEVKVNERSIATLEEGACVGEMSLIEQSPRTADVVALSYCDVYILTFEAFEDLRRRFTSLNANLKGILDSRRAA